MITLPSLMFFPKGRGWPRLSFASQAMLNQPSTVMTCPVISVCASNTTSSFMF
jgi:hypothetical protein